MGFFGVQWVDVEEGCHLQGSQFWRCTFSIFMKPQSSASQPSHDGLGILPWRPRGLPLESDRSFLNFVLFCFIYFIIPTFFAIICHE
jgi:hypothetical protein